MAYYLAIILYCSTPLDATTCDVMVRRDHLFDDIEICQKQVVIVGSDLRARGHFVKGACFEFNPYGEQI